MGLDFDLDLVDSVLAFFFDTALLGVQEMPRAMVARMVVRVMRIFMFFCAVLLFFSNLYGVCQSKELSEAVLLGLNELS